MDRTNAEKFLRVLDEEDTLEQVRNDMMKKGCTAEAATRQVERLRWYNYHADDKLAGQDDEAWQLVDATVDDTPGEEICDSPERGRTESPEREAMTADLTLAFTKSGGIGDGSGCHRSRRPEIHFSKWQPITDPSISDYATRCKICFGELRANSRYVENSKEPITKDD